MARYNANSLLNSLRGKIWLATSAMAFFICTFGLISYLVVSFVVDDTFYAIFVPFLVLAFGIMVFGWWLSNELVTPIEKVGMLAKSLERSATTSLPKTTGSVETDELLQTLHRNSRQMQTVVSLMDEVANGNTDVALSPLQGSDRLSGSFQKLLAKVSESIDAKQQLETLQLAVAQVKDDISTVRKGNLAVEIRADFKETKEISETLRFLINSLSEIVTQIRLDSEFSRTNAHEIRQTLQGLINHKESRVLDLNEAAAELRNIPIGIEKIADDLSKAVAFGNDSLEAAQRGTRFTLENRNGLGSLRKQIQEAVGRISRLTERSQEITKIAKTVEDIAHRTNMIALNASIQAGETGDKASGFSAVTDEIQRLAERADNTNKHISVLNKSISVEIGEVERSLGAATKEISDLSKLVIETGNSVGEVEKYLSQFVGLQKQITANSREQSIRSERAYKVFEGSIDESERMIGDLRQTEQSVAGFAVALKNIENAAAPFKLGETAEETSSGPDYSMFGNEVEERKSEAVEAL
ncbi:MAG: hypothetical protein IPK58_18695 [Acidobacteria bacterium]|nr:hypothetical protein [Acidobacteriota bacterium]